MYLESFSVDFEFYWLTARASEVFSENSFEIGWFWWFFMFLSTFEGIFVTQIDSEVQKFFWQKSERTTSDTLLPRSRALPATQLGVSQPAPPPPSGGSDENEEFQGLFESYDIIWQLWKFLGIIMIWSLRITNRLIESCLISHLVLHRKLDIDRQNWPDKSAYNRGGKYDFATLERDITDNLSFLEAILIQTEFEICSRELGSFGRLWCLFLWSRKWRMSLSGERAGSLLPRPSRRTIWRMTSGRASWASLEIVSKNLIKLSRLKCSIHQFCSYFQ